MDLVPKEYRQKPGVENSKPSSGLGKLSLPKFSHWELPSGSFLRGLTILAGVILALLLLGWGGLAYYEKSLNEQISALKDKQSKVFSSDDKQLVVQMNDFEIGATLLQDILKNHIYVTGLLDAIATSTLTQVQWNSFGLNVRPRGVNLNGSAANYSILAKQILALQNGGFSKVVVSGINLGKAGGVDFSVGFEFNQKIIQK